MKTTLLLLIAASIHTNAQQASYINFVRQHQQGTNVIWDMPVQPVGSANSMLALESGGALFQLWTIDQAKATDYLLDQKLVGAYLPKADIKIITLDPDSKIPRTRVDQPFRVEIQVSDLLTGPEFPLSASTVLLQRHVAAYTSEQPVLDRATVVAGTPLNSGYLNANGQHVLAFPASALNASNPTKASGEEHFVIHAISDGSFSQTELAAAHVQVWPVASGAIKGIANGDELRFRSPNLELLLNDLYPRSDTYLLLYEGSSIHGNTGVIVSAFPMDRDAAESHVVPVSDMDSKFKEDGTYTLALVSDTVFGRELLCAPVTFSINRTMHVNAMQVGFSDIKGLESR